MSQPIKSIGFQPFQRSHAKLDEPDLSMDFLMRDFFRLQENSYFLESELKDLPTLDKYCGTLIPKLEKSGKCPLANLIKKCINELKIGHLLLTTSSSFPLNCDVFTNESLLVFAKLAPHLSQQTVESVFLQGVEDSCLETIDYFLPHIVLLGEKKIAEILMNIVKTPNKLLKKEIISLFVKHAPLNGRDSFDRCILHIAVLFEELEIVKLLGSVKHLSINSKDANGFTPLHYAILNQQREIFDVLISLGANVNMSNHARESALHIAVRSNWTYAVRHLLHNSAHPSSWNEHYETPLHLSVKAGNIDISLLLAKNKGTNCYARDKKGYYPYNYLPLSWKNEEIGKLLKPYPFMRNSI